MALRAPPFQCVYPFLYRSAALSPRSARHVVGPPSAYVHARSPARSVLSLACSRFARSMIPLVPLALGRKQPLARRATVFASGGTGVREPATSGRECECGWLSLPLFSSLRSSLLFSLIRGLCSMPKTSVHLLSRKESERRRAGRSRERERVGAHVRMCVRGKVASR